MMILPPVPEPFPEPVFYLFQNPSLSLTPPIAAAINIKSVVLEVHLVMTTMRMTVIEMAVMLMIIYLSCLLYNDHQHR